MLFTIFFSLLPAESLFFHEFSVGRVFKNNPNNKEKKMDSAILKEILNKLEDIKKTTDTKVLELDNQDILQVILKSIEDFKNIYLSENQEITATIQEIGKKHV